MIEPTVIAADDLCLVLSVFLQIFELPDALCDGFSEQQGFLLGCHKVSVQSQTLLLHFSNVKISNTIKGLLVKSKQVRLDHNGIWVKEGKWVRKGNLKARARREDFRRNQTIWELAVLVLILIPRTSNILLFYMEKFTWNSIVANLNTENYPPLRWGHSCCFVEDEIMVFGGYADSNYMNDMWAFNTITMEWRTIETTGEVPSVRSNCSICYDEPRRRIILFGGGGPSKQRFNSINILDWKTKEWSTVKHLESSPVPEERTYHASQLFYPYLVVFGGESIADLNDLWTFNFETSVWKEVQFPKDTVKPCARRFHTSAKIDTKFYIIAGCHTKYRCLSDVYELDIASLLETGDTDALRWKELKLRSTTFLARWGHSSAVHADKIYIFGGRFSNDLNDLIVVDVAKNTMDNVKISNYECPKPRRRHSSIFCGSSMVIFGGFNGQYFNDLNYINLYECKKTKQINPQSQIERVKKYVSNPQYSDCILLTTQNQQFHCHMGLIRQCFKNNQQLLNFLHQIQKKYTLEELKGIFSTMYQGYGQLPLKFGTQYDVQVYETLAERKKDLFSSYREETEQSSTFGSLIKKFKSKENMIVKLRDQSFTEFLYAQRNKDFSDAEVIINKEISLPVNKAQLCIHSSFFSNIFSAKFLESKTDVDISIDYHQFILFEMLLNFLSSGYLVSPEDMSCENWMQFLELADYYGIPDLVNICEKEIKSHINQANSDLIMNFSICQGLEDLTQKCAHFQIKTMVECQESCQISYYESECPRINLLREQKLKKVYKLIRLDILQQKIRKEMISQSEFREKGNKGETREEKENFQRKHNYIN